MKIVPAALALLLAAVLVPAFSRAASEPAWDVVAGEAVWSGELVVTRPVRVEKGAVLRIAPGAKILFDIEGADPSLPWIDVAGKIAAEGTSGEKIRIKPAKSMAKYHSHDMFSVVEAEGAVFRNVVFEEAGWAVHLHDTPGAVFEGCEFSKGYGGVRFKSDGVVFSGNTFEGNRIGVRLINSRSPLFRGNAFSGNLTGIFFREGVEDAVLEGNGFDDLEYDVKLGERQDRDVLAAGNRWRTGQGGGPGEFIYDREDDPSLGRVIVEDAGKGRR